MILTAYRRDSITMVNDAEETGEKMSAEWMRDSDELQYPANSTDSWKMFWSRTRIECSAVGSVTYNASVCEVRIEWVSSN